MTVRTRRPNDRQGAHRAIEPARLGSATRTTRAATPRPREPRRSVTGEDIELLWSRARAATWHVDPAAWRCCGWTGCRALTGVYPGIEREDDMVAAFDFCRHGKGGAAPSIDTAMHALVEQPHVDHLHPTPVSRWPPRPTARSDAGLLRRPGGVGAVAAAGFQLGLDIAAIAAANPQAIGCVLGGHGITAWGPTSEECEARRLRSSGRRGVHRDRGARSRSAGHRGLPAAARDRRGPGGRAGPGDPRPGLHDRRQVGHYNDAEVVLDFLSRAGHPRCRARHVVPRSLPAHQGAPMVLDCRRTLRSPTPRPGCGSCTRLPAGLRRLLPAVRRPDSPRDARRDPAIVLVPGVGISATARTSRPPGWPASST